MEFQEGFVIVNGRWNFSFYILLLLFHMVSDGVLHMACDEVDHMACDEVDHIAGEGAVHMKGKNS